MSQVSQTGTAIGIVLMDSDRDAAVAMASLLVWGNHHWLSLSKARLAYGSEGAISGHIHADRAMARRRTTSTRLPRR
jgi:hypothetical protein